MCESCGCGDRSHATEDLGVLRDPIADRLRAQLVGHGVLAVRLLGAPRAGKTAVLAQTAQRLGGRRHLAAITGALDAEHLRATGMTAHVIETGAACHLDADRLARALAPLRIGALDLLFIEEIGDLICPARHDLGQGANVVALAVTDGVDTPLKYPWLFRRADLVLLTKVDLASALGLDLGALRDGVARVMPAPHVIEVSGATGEGIDEWLTWLEARRPVAGHAVETLREPELPGLLHPR